jgi:hypothetical protein
MSFKQLTSGNASNGGALAELAIQSPMDITLKGTTHISR